MRRALAALAVLATGCASPLTPARLGPSFGEVFQGLYAQQQALLGRSAEAGGLTTTCRRTGTDGTGPGEDWVCAVQYVDTGTSGAQVFEVQVKPDGCWKATGAPAVQPAQLVDALSSAKRTNPLAEFDGCLDTSWR